MKHTTLHPATIMLTLALFAFSITASASSSYDFSYTVHDGTTLSGSFDGTANGNLITDITNLSVVYTGQSPVSPLVESSFTPGGPVFGGAVISFDGLANNFSFTDASAVPSTFFELAFLSCTDPVSCINFLPNTFIQYHIPGSGSGAGSIFVGDAQLIAANWSVTSSVPVPAAVWLFGSGLMGLLGLGKRKHPYSLSV